MSNITPAITSIVFGVLSLILGQATIISQLSKILKSRNTHGISVTTYILFVLTVLIFNIWSYGQYFNRMIIGAHDGVPAGLYQATLLPTVIMNNLNLISMSIVLGLKLRNIYLVKKYKLDEDVIAEKLVINRKLDWRITFALVIAALYLFVTGITLLLVFTWHPVMDPNCKTWLWVILVNFIAGITNESINWPQFVKTIKHRETSNIAIGWTICLPLNSSFLFLYSLFLLFNSADVNLSSLGSCVFNGLIPAFGLLIIKINNMVKAKKLGITEKQYIKQWQKDKADKAK